MGHKDTMTTSKNYWVANVLDLQEQMNNPFTGTYQAKQEKKSEEALEMELLKAQKQKAIEIIDRYNILMNQNEDKSVKEIKQPIKQDLPKLNEHLSLIADETGSDSDDDN